MVRKRLNEIFSSRFFYMLFSLLAAIALWMYVEITENNVNLYEVANVPVTFKGMDILRDKGLLIASQSPENVTLTFECPLSYISRLTNETLSVEIDLTGITTTGMTSREYNVIYPAGVDHNLANLTTKSDTRIMLSVDRVSSKTVPVMVEYKAGTASEDLMADTPIRDPQQIRVRGPEEVVSKIKDAFVPIPRESLASTFEDDLEFVLRDENGEEFDEKRLEGVTFSAEMVRVTIPIKQKKDISLSASCMHGAGSTDINTKITVEPPFITLAGDPDAMKELNTIILTTIDTVRLRELTTIESYPIFYENYYEILSGVKEATVTIELLGLTTKYSRTENLQVSNVPVGFTYKIINESVVVLIRGTEEDLNYIMEDDNGNDNRIRIVADLTDREAGTHRIPAKVYIDGTDANIGAVGEYTLTVILQRDTK